MEGNRKLFLIVICAIIGRCTSESHFPRELNFYELLEDFEGDLGNTTCSQDVRKLFSSLNETWAQQMIDATGKIPSGILKLNWKSLGQYDECIEIQSPAINFTGKYCPLGGIINSNNSQTNQSGDSRMTEVGPLNSFLTITLGVCVPSSCTGPEVAQFINGLLNSTLISFAAAESDCSTNEAPELEDTDWVAVGFLSLICLIAVLSTLFDAYQRIVIKNAKPSPLWSSFSIYSNGLHLFKISKGPGQMGALHGIRTLSMCWVIVCHSYAFSMFAPTENFADVSKILDGREHVIITNGYVSVDSFFFLSGLLVCFIFFRDMSKKGGSDVPLNYIQRWLRLTPPLAVMILIQATIFSYLGDGPLWHSFSTSISDPCRKNWWLNILYVQNYVDSATICISQSWYLASDMQMYWVAPFILFPMYFWPKLAPAFLVILTLGATFTNFAIAYVNHLGPSLFSATNANQNTLDYFPFHTRMAPYIIGIACGYLLCGIQAKKIRVNLSPMYVIAGWIFSTGVCLACIYSIVYFQENTPTNLEIAFYLSFHRAGWALGLSWIVFACLNGYGGLVNSFLSWEVFQPLAKLSYCTYIIHLTIQYYRIGSQRTTFFLSDLEIVYKFCGDLILANLLAIPFTLLFEMPVSNLYRLCFRNLKILPLPLAKKKKLQINEKELEEGKDNQAFENEKPTEK